jgi:predicted nucleotide-binding protein
MTEANLRLSKLFARLRDLESEILSLSELGLTPELDSEDATYKMRLETLEKSHTRSWFGDHATTYFVDFHEPPSGQSFDVEWGFVPGYSGSRNPNWRTYTREEIRVYVFDQIGEGIFHAYVALEKKIIDRFKQIHSQALDVIELLGAEISMKSLARYEGEIEQRFTPVGFGDYINASIKTAPNMTLDSSEIAKGQSVPPHIQYQSNIWSVKENKRRLASFAGTIRNVIEIASFIQTKEIRPNPADKIFIGHGRSFQWMVLKDFLSERLGLKHEEFNRVSPAGIGTQERLAEMLDQCGFAFLVMTGEDYHNDESLHARENVIHEVGLFQGRYGWRKAIILLEEDCGEFSNISGLGQIRFPKGNLAAKFEEVRAVLERENMISK